MNHNLRGEIMSAGQPNLAQRKLLTATQAVQPTETDIMLNGSKKVSKISTNFSKLFVAYEFLLLIHHYFFEILHCRHREVEQDKQTTRNRIVLQPKISHRDRSLLRKMYN